MIARDEAGFRAALVLGLSWLAASSALAQEAGARDERTDGMQLAAPDAGGRAAPPVAERQEVRFRFESQPAGLALDLITGHGFTRHSTLAIGMSPATGTGVLRVRRGAYRPLCTSPCTGTLPRGLHTFGLTHPNGQVWVALPPLAFSDGEPVSIRGELHEHSGERLGGGLFLVLGGLAGLGGFGGGLATLLSSEELLDGPEGQAGLGLVVGSGALLLLAVAVGLPLVFYVDRAWVVRLAPE